MRGVSVTGMLHHIPITPGLTVLPGMGISDFRELYFSKVSRATRAKKGKGSNIGALINLTDEKGNGYKLQISSLFGGFNLKCLSTPADLQNSPEIHKMPPLYISGFVGLLSAEERAFPAAIQERLASGKVSTIIRNLLLDTKNNSAEKYAKLVSRLKKDFGFHLDQIEFNVTKDLFVKAHYSEVCETNNLLLDFNSSGSGFMQILQILTPIYRYCPDVSTVVLLDEPDAHLHPNLQAALAKTLREVQQELGIQIIISTHSTSIIRAAAPNEVIAITSSASENMPLSSEEDVDQEIQGRIDTYELGKSVISGKLVFFEDSNLNVIEQMDKVLGTSCFSGGNTVPIIAGRGKDDKVPFQLVPIIKKYTNKDVEVHFVRDGDGLTPDWRAKLSEHAKAHNVVLHQINLFEIESYLLSPSLISRAIIKKYPSTPASIDAEVNLKILQFLKETISLSKFRYDDGLEDTIFKTALLLSIGEYRNPQTVKSEAIRIRETYETYTTLSDLLVAGMGKETLKLIMHWLNSEKSLNISMMDLISSLEATDIPTEVSTLLSALKSKEKKPDPIGLPLFEAPQLEDDDDDEEDEEQSAVALAE